MAFPNALRRARGLGGTNWLLLAEALPALVLASAAIKLLPFRKVAAAASRGGPPSEDGPADEAYLRKVRWAVNAWADRVPWRTVCFQRGLALHRMLRRRGIPSVLHYGVNQTEKGVGAHVWVTVEGRPVMGGEEAPNFACLALFPEPSQPTGLPIG